jgi:hypothetical protein
VEEETGVKSLPLGILAIHELNLPLPLPDGVRSEAELSGEALARREHSARWGPTHLGVHALSIAADESVPFRDPDEITEVAWLPRERFGEFHDHVAVMIRAADAAGVLEEAAALARRAAAGEAWGVGLAGGGGSGSAGGGAAPPALHGIIPMSQLNLFHKRAGAVGGHIY